MKRTRDLLLALGMLVTIPLLGQYALPALPALRPERQDTVRLWQGVGAFEFPAFTPSPFDDFRLDAAPEQREDIFVTYTKPPCCKRWTWAVQVAVHGQPAIHLGVKFLIDK